MAGPGVIIYLHGMAGGHLARPAGAGKAWLSVRVALRGELGASLSAANTLVPAGHVKLFHRPAALYWRAARGFTVHEFSYDWRLGFDAAAGALRDTIEAIPAGLPIFIVAHSMGGCIACRFSVLYPQQARRIERAYFLGVPVHGSFAAVSVLLGEFTLQRILAAAAVLGSRARALADIRAACRQMAGVMDLLPDPARFSTAHLLYDNANWPAESAPGQQQLDRVLALKRAMPESPLLDRTIVLASRRWPTPGGVHLTSAGIGLDPQLRVPGDGVTALVSARTLRATRFAPLDFPHAFLMLEPAALRAVGRLS